MCGLQKNWDSIKHIHNPQEHDIWSDSHPRMIAGLLYFFKNNTIESKLVHFIWIWTSRAMTCNNNSVALVCTTRILASNGWESNTKQWAQNKDSYRRDTKEMWRISFSPFGGLPLLLSHNKCCTLLNLCNTCKRLEKWWEHKKE